MSTMLIKNAGGRATLKDKNNEVINLPLTRGDAHCLLRSLAGAQRAEDVSEPNERKYLDTYGDASCRRYLAERILLLVDRGGEYNER